MKATGSNRKKKNTKNTDKHNFKPVVKCDI